MTVSQVIDALLLKWFGRGQTAGSRCEEIPQAPGRLMTNVLASFLAIGGLVILLNAYEDLWFRPIAAFWIWVALSGAICLATVLIFDIAYHEPRLVRTRALWLAFGLLVIAFFATSVIFHNIVGPDRWDHVGDAPMVMTSFIVGTILGLSLRAIGALTRIRRAWARFWCS